jgi:hypothetical protein
MGAGDGFYSAFFLEFICGDCIADPGIGFRDGRVHPAKSREIRGKTVMLDEGSTLQYGADGSYVYTLGGRVSRGKWSIGSNGAVCIAFANGGGRCDTYLEQNGKLYLRNSNGSLYRVQFAR